MLKGDLVTTPLPAVLRQLADGVVSGCLHIDDGVGGKAKVYLRGGHVYAVQVPGRRPQLGARLVSSGALGPEALAEALEAQRTELQGWRLGELLVHLGYVDQPVVEAFIDEQLREQTTDLMRWPTGTWKFRVNERTREDVAPPTPVETLLAAVEERRQQWDVITEVLHGPDAVPMLSAAGQTDDEMAIDPDAWSLLCKVDGVRSVSELAKECGFTLFEAGQVVYSLVRTGLLEVEETLAPEAPAEPFAPIDVTSKLAAAFAPSEPEVVIPAQAESHDLEMSPADVANLVANALREDRSLDAAPSTESDDIDASVDRVSQALSQMLGEDKHATDDLFAAPKVRARGAARPPKPKTPSEIERERKQNARAEASKKRRAADAEELALAQAELEAARAAEAAADAAKLAADHEAEVVSLAEARRAAEERAAAEAAEAARIAEERAAAEAARIAEERAAAEAEMRAAAEAAEASRLAEEQAAAERAAAEEAARLEAERVAAEEAEAARIAAEAAAVAERAQAEAELREAAEKQAAEEAAAAAAEAERLEAERVAAEAAEAERQAAEIAAAEERARVEAELREAAEKEAAEEAARLEAERVAAEAAEAERQAAEIAASEERARVEEELRLAAEAEAAEAARVEAERLAAEQEAARLAAEAAEAERLAEEEAEQSRSVEERLHAADAFAELSATAATAGDTLVAEAPVHTDLEDDDLDEDLDEGPLPTYPPADTDMASLFRELSSLGLEDEPSSSSPAPPAPRPRPSGTPAAAGKHKKKGLFGR